MPTILGRISTDGKLDPIVRQQIAKALETYAGKTVEIELKLHRAKRSSQANRFYHGVVVKLLAEHCGYDHDDMHEALAMKFLRIEDCPVTGAPRRMRTPQCDTAAFAVYVDQCIRLALDLGVVIPEPGEVAA